MIRREAGLFRRISTGGLIVTLSAVLFLSVACTQDPESVEKISDLGLPTLSGEVTVHYSEGCKKRAAYLQGILEAANRFLATGPGLSRIGPGGLGEMDANALRYGTHPAWRVSRGHLAGRQ